MKPKANHAALLLVALLLPACESKEPTNANDKPSAQTSTEASPSKSASPAAAKPGPKEFPSPSGFDLKPLAVGQWIRIANTVESSPPTQTFVRIVGKEGNDFWYEIETNTPKGTTIIQFLMDEAARKNFQKSSIKKLRVKAGQAPVQEYSGPMLAMVGSIVEDQVSLFGQPDLATAKREDTQTSAGSFKGCYVYETEKTMLGVATKLKSHNHPAVPITGFVRSEGKAGDRKVASELLEMHDDGAKSSL